MAKILIIDDDVSFLNLISKWLEIEDHEVIGASNGEIATQILSNDTFDLIITDIVMPDKEGIELIMEIRKEDKEVPILAVSGAGSKPDDYLKNAKLLGANRILTKPVYHDFFIGTVNELLK